MKEIIIEKISWTMSVMVIIDWNHETWWNCIVSIVGKPIGLEPFYEVIPEELITNKNGDGYDHLERNSHKISHYQVLEEL